MGTTLVDQLLHWSSTAPDSVAFRWLRDDGSEEAILSFAALETQTSIVSSRLMNEWLVGKGERALLVYLPGLAFISAFLVPTHAASRMSMALVRPIPPILTGSRAC